MYPPVPNTATFFLSRGVADDPLLTEEADIVMENPRDRPSKFSFTATSRRRSPAERERCRNAIVKPGNYIVVVTENYRLG